MNDVPAIIILSLVCFMLGMYATLHFFSGSLRSMNDFMNDSDDALKETLKIMDEAVAAKEKYEKLAEGIDE